MSRAVLITGATGKQGGSVIQALLDQNADFEILAVTRDASSNSAQKLQRKSTNIKLVEGNLDQPEDIFIAAEKATSQRIWGLFSVQVPATGSSNQDIEEKQGKDLVDAALKHNVKFFLYSSVQRGDNSFENPTPVPHFISKHNIEHYLVRRAEVSGMDYTILRPVAFLDNFTPDFFGKVFTTSWKVALREKPLQVISTRDIGFFGAKAFLNPDQYKGKGLSLAGDELTFKKMAEIFKAKTGKNVPLTYEFICRFLMWMMKDFGYMMQWFYDVGYGADIAAMREIHPGLKTFEEWLEVESEFDTK
ncbi:hypothetical protein N7532_001785 [Penicillium argentinense]|uniref:NmrA-like domain-containing protein n=1 Tax=Penicillium argentinense TaxID=1131581 RepID=A0A9W9G345_9EURO|nr:uncharacterized protein N7532_001785 [Penicillium argentinense]KAJ5111250.1 hypothetical protein N7532_001785 [Penicillium argentinense]